MFKLVLFLGLGLAVSRGSTIDSGYVFTAPYFASDATTVQLNVASSDGNFALSGLGIPGGANLDCTMGGGFCPFGQSYSIEAFFPDASSYGVVADAVIDGHPAGSVTLGCPSSACPHSLVRLIAQPVDISSPGTYVVPFYATGEIQASQGIGDLILDQTISGFGSLSFSVSTFSSGYFQVGGPPGGSLGLRWLFAPVPEPSMLLPTLLGLAAILWRRHFKRRTKTLRQWRPILVPAAAGLPFRRSPPRSPAAPRTRPPGPRPPRHRNPRSPADASLPGAPPPASTAPAKA